MLRAQVSPRCLVDISTTKDADYYVADMTSLTKNIVGLKFEKKDRLKKNCKICNKADTVEKMLTFILSIRSYFDPKYYATHLMQQNFL